VFVIDDVTVGVIVTDDVTVGDGDMLGIIKEREMK